MYSSVVTLANSIIGVSILAMPYCFKQVRMFVV
jgi:amino acid permease